MRYDKNRVLMIIVIALLTVLLTILTVFAVISLKERDQAAGAGSSAGTQNTTQSSTPTAEDQVIETPYGKMVFPGEWARYLKTELNDGADYGISFYAELESGKTQPLFSLQFGEPKHPAAGQVTTQDGVTVGVYVTVRDFVPDETWSDQETAIVTSMQEALNDVLDSLNLQPLGATPPELQGDELVIDTPYGSLYFPGQWVEELEITTDESDGYEVIFHGAIGGHEAQPLFAVNFGGTKGTVVHTMTTDNGVLFYVRLRTFELNTEGWSGVDAATIRAMQEDLNHMLSKLTAQ